MNIPDSVARHVRSRTVIADISANPETARRRMSAANGQLTKASSPRPATTMQGRTGKPPVCQ